MATKNDNKTLPMLIGAIVLGLVAALLSAAYLSVREKAIEKKYAQEKVGNIQVEVVPENCTGC